MKVWEYNTEVITMRQELEKRIKELSMILKYIEDNKECLDMLNWNVYKLQQQITHYQQKISND